jgi:hypothetical protein
LQALLGGDLRGQEITHFFLAAKAQWVVRYNGIVQHVGIKIRVFFRLGIFQRISREPPSD